MASSDTVEVPITLLDAVNVLLKAVGLANVMSLNAADTDGAAQDALQALNDECRVVQEKGWHVNTEEEYPLLPNTEGFILTPPNAAAVVTSLRSSSKDLAWRGGKLYDRREHTFTFTDKIYVDVVWTLQFDELPPYLRWLITSKAGSRFGVGRVPDTMTYRFTREVAEEAMSAALHSDQEARNAWGGERNPHMQFQRRL